MLDRTANRIIVDGNGRRSAQHVYSEPCPVERGMRLIGGKWTGSILCHLHEGPVRFNDLSRMIGGASKKMLTERLRQLEAQGMVTRTVRDTAPVTVDYTLTDFGRSALEVLDHVRQWSLGVADDKLQRKRD